MVAIKLFWSIFWRMMIVIISSSLISTTIAQVSYTLQDQTEVLIKLRWVLTWVPAMAIFLLMSQILNHEKRVLFENLSGIKMFTWHHIYRSFAFLSCGMTIILMLGAVFLSTKDFIDFRSIVPFFSFIILCVVLSLRVSKSAFQQLKND